MNITVNEKSLSLLINETDSNADIIEFLNAVIDEEIEKENPDCDLIDECINAIADIENTDAKLPAIRIALTPDSIRKIVNPKRTSWNNLNRALRIAIVAAVIATGTFTVNAAVKTATGVDVIKEIASAVVEVFNSSKNDKEAEYENNFNLVSEQTTSDVSENEPQTEEQTQSQQDGVVNVKPQTAKSASGSSSPDKPLITQPTVSYAPAVNNGKNNGSSSGNANSTQPVFTGVEAQYADMKRNLIVGEKLSYDGMRVYAHYSDGSKKQVPIEDCTRPTAFDTSKVGDYSLKVQYQSAVFTFGVTVRPDEETRYSTICENKDYNYLLTSRGAYVVKYKGSSKSLNLNSIDGNSVYAVTSSAFEGLNIKEITSNSIVKVYARAFRNCTSLKKCNMPRCSIICNDAFYGCNGLDEFTLAPKLTSIGSGSFAKSNIQSVTLSADITKIPDFAFSECKNLTDVNMLGKVASVGKNAFCECESLLNVNGTAYIVSVDDFGFYGCEFMEFDSELVRLHSAGNCAFAMCKSACLGDLYGLTNIGVQAFQYCSNIDSVYITGNVKVIPNAAFQGAHIKTLTIDDGVEIIEPYAFMSTLIGELYLPPSVKEIGTYAFYTSAIRTVKGGKNVSEVGSRAFYPSKRLTIYVDENNALSRYASDNGIKCIVGNTGEEQEA